ncbi:MAG TPA: lysylphosphatidylglycerol synthase transmembrane domain-containing protein [Candidatus Saccharimonadales bacterium]|nr:lysylphosphatidylglycerol synthase transmembrane domain-containing protein [Candidatus Saccharimonadales bacterium]
MAKAQVADVHQRLKGRLLLLLFFLLFMYVVVPRLGNFADSLKAIKEVRGGHVLLAVVPLVATYLFAALTYQCLALKRLHLRRTILVQMANGFAGRLLPAGLGGLTLNVQYLRRSGHALTQAVTVAGMNNTLGLIGHSLLLSAAILFSGTQLSDGLQLPHPGHGGWIGAGVLIVAAILVLVFRTFRDRVHSLALKVTGNMKIYRQRPIRLLFALGLSMGVTCGYALTFYLCCQSVGIMLPIGTIFMIFTFGMLTTTATPTPGGLGGAEAGLIMGLMAYETAAPIALASVLLYRLLSYWLPLLPGLVVFLSVRKKYL